MAAARSASALVARGHTPALHRLTMARAAPRKRLFASLRLEMRTKAGHLLTAAAADAGADAVLAASVFHFGQLTVGQVKDHLRATGHTVR